MEQCRAVDDLWIGAVRGQVPVGLLDGCCQFVVDSGELADQQLGFFVIGSGEVAVSIRLDRVWMLLRGGERLGQFDDRLSIVRVAEPFEHSSEPLRPRWIIDQGAAPIEQNGMELSVGDGHARTLDTEGCRVRPIVPRMFTVAEPAVVTEFGPTVTPDDPDPRRLFREVASGCSVCRWAGRQSLVRWVPCASCRQGWSDGGRNALTEDQGVAAAVGSVRLRCGVRSWRCWLVAGEATAPWRARQP